MQNYGNKGCNPNVDILYNNENEVRGDNLPQLLKVRPMVNPEAEGNVDPNRYPLPKEATHKIRGKNDFIEYLFGAVDQELLTVKTFYFFFYSAFGSLFPLMGVYFKQMGMNAGQCGLLIGLRPFIEFLSAPFWGSWADRWQKGKMILLASLSCWIIFTLPLGFIQPPATSCMIYKNYTNYLYIPDSNRRILKRSIPINNVLVENFSQDFKNKVRLDSKQLNNEKNNEVIIPILEQISHDKINKDNSYRNKRNEFYTKIFQNTEKVNLIDLIRNYKISNILELKNFFKNDSSGKDYIKSKSNTKIHGHLIISKILNPGKIIAQPEVSQLYTSTELSNLKVKGTLFFNYKNQNLNDLNQYQQNQIILIDANNKNKISNLNKIKYNLDDIKFNFQRYRRSIKMLSSSAGQSPISVNYASNYNDTNHKGWVKPIFSSIVYRLPDIQKTFFLLLLLVVVGEFFSAPAITLADSAVITLLGEDADRYGHQRMFGSLGWGLAMFFVGIALDHSTAFSEHPCGPDAKEKNYTICFAIFSVLMGAALITATQINFKYDFVSIESVVQKSPIQLTKEEQLQNQLSQQLNLPGLQDSLNINVNSRPQHTEDKTKMFAQTTREIPEWVTILKQFKDLKCASFLFVAWFMGFGIGLIFTFLFWHLQDYGGTPTLFGVASVINHISEIFAYFFSFRLIRQIGHVKVLCLGLGGNVIRFLYISWLKNPWWVLPFEFIQGITHAAVWAACCSYIAHNTPTPLRSNAQGVLQGLHHGLGRGCGAVIGGMFVSIYGTTATFHAYGLICLVVLIAFIFINFYRKDTGFISNLPQTEDPHQVAEVTHLAPHGVPSNAIPRALSSNRLHELSNQDSSYGATYNTSSSNLNIPGGNGASINSNNPFLSGICHEEDHCKITIKGDDEFIRRSFQCYSEIVDSEFNIMKMPHIATHLHTQQPCTNPFHQHDYDW